jgi:ADP-ribose pyrophosphatase YjhB (NUDIX family)
VRSPFTAYFPTTSPLVVELARHAIVAEDDAREAMIAASSGAAVPPGELVVWAWTFDAGERQTLLVDHPRFGQLLPAGGRAEPGEDPRRAVLRELHEETGRRGTLLDDKPALIDAVRHDDDDGHPVQTFGMAFVVRADRDSPLTCEPGQPALWVPLDARPERARERHWNRLVSRRRSGSSP